MKVAVFGTGIYYQHYKCFLEDCEVLFLLDNNKEKQGKILDGKNIFAPEDVDFALCDFIIILVKAYQEIEMQLVSLRVPSNKIIPYVKMGKVIPNKSVIKTKSGVSSLNEWLVRNPKNRIMVISHELSRTGVPVALMNLTLLLKEMNYSVLYVSMRGGTLREELTVLNIEYMDALALTLYDNDFLELANLFDRFIFGTAVLSDIVPIFSQFNKPIMWWIHETEKSIGEQKLELNSLDNVKFFAGGPRVKKALIKMWNIDDVEELLYFLPDLKEKKQKKKRDKIHFSIIGAFSERKAQDILAEAIKKITGQYKDEYIVDFVGNINDINSYYNNLKNTYPDLYFVGEMTQDELEKYYDEIDVLICPSRDDPMPIVVTQAMRHSIPCIVSDCVGQATYIEHEKNGFIFKSENSIELANIMQEIIKGSFELEKMGKNAFDVFEENFSVAQMKRKMTTYLGERVPSDE